MKNIWFTRRLSRLLIAPLFVVSLLSFNTSLSAQDPQTDPRYYVQQAIEAHKKKDYQSFLRNMSEVLKLRPNQPVFMYNLAAAYSLLRNKSEALRWLQRVADMGMVFNATQDEDFDSIKDTREFDAILKQFEINRAASGSSSEAFTINEKGLIPEGIAFDSKTGSFFIGSVHKRKIIRVDRHNNLSEFASARDGLWGVLGMRVDETRRVLWVASSSVPQIENYQSSEDGFAAVLKFDLRSGRLIKRYVLSNNGAKHVLGDLLVDSRGYVFTTDSLSPAVYVIRPENDQLEMFIDRGPFVSPQGLAFSPDEKRMFVADYPLGIFVVDRDKKTWVHLSASPSIALVGIDGLYYHRGSLIGIQNGTNPRRVVRLVLGKTLGRVERFEVMEANNPIFDEPTLGVVTNGWLYYIANSQWGKIDDAGKFTRPELLRDVTILKIRL